MLIHVDFLHLSTVKSLLECLALTTQLLSLLSAVGVTNLALHGGVFFTEIIHLDLLLINYTTQCVNDGLELLHRLKLSVSQLDSVASVGEFLTSKLCSLFFDGCKLNLPLVLQIGGD